MSSSKLVFQNGSAVDEIIAAMQNSLAPSLSKQASSNFDKLAHAADLLNGAAKILDNNGFTNEVDDITQILEELANG